MVRLLIEDVTLFRDQAITAHIRFKGGASQTLVLPLPLPIGELRKTDAAIVREIDRLMNDHTDEEIAAILNERRLLTGDAKPFTRLAVWRVRRRSGLTDRFTRLRAAGMLTLEEMATRLDVCTATVKAWSRHGLLVSHPYNDKRQQLYEPPGPDLPLKGKRKFTGRPTPPPSTS
jgi:hypothetical protein